MRRTWEIIKDIPPKKYWNYFNIFLHFVCNDLIPLVVYISIYIFWMEIMWFPKIDTWTFAKLLSHEQCNKWLQVYYLYFSRVFFLNMWRKKTLAKIRNFSRVSDLLTHGSLTPYESPDLYDQGHYINQFLTQNKHV